MKELWSPFDNMTFSLDKCFLCGIELNAENSTDEHIFPKWLQRKFNLWNLKLTLLNNENITYKHLTVPCCTPCNQLLQRKLEAPISKAVEEGYEEFKKLDEMTIAQWLMKIKFGLLYKELYLKYNIRDSKSPMILTSKDLENFRMLYILLQTVRFNSIIHEPKPWSILIFHIINEEDKNYFGDDLLLANMFRMQLNDIGIIATFQDSGMHGDFFKEHRKDFLNIRLHPIQFRELCASMHYKSILVEMNPKYINSFNEKYKELTILEASNNAKYIREWNQKEYAGFLSWHLYQNFDHIDELYFTNDEVMSWLYEKNGEPRIFNNLEEGYIKK